MRKIGVGIIFMINFCVFSQTASFQVSYTGITPQAQLAFEKATEIWSNILISNVPIKINLTWGDASSLGVLGITISNGIKDFSNAPYANVWYPSSLADALAGNDLQPNQTDMDIFMDSSSDWYYGTDGNCPFWKQDLVSCALHEIGHGLGFYSVANINTQNEGSFSLQIDPFATALASFPLPNLNGEPLVYDLFVQNGQGNSLIDTNLFSNPSNLLANEFTGNDLYFAGPNTLAANNNNPARIHATSAFSFGSSFLHLDESVYHSGTSESLMTPYSSAGEVNHLPGKITAGVLMDIGWNIATADIPHEELFNSVIYPNPIKEKATISFNVKKSSEVLIEIYNSIGMKVLPVLQKQVNVGLCSLEIKTSSLCSGTYFCHLSIDGVLQKQFPVIK